MNVEFQVVSIIVLLVIFLVSSYYYFAFILGEDEHLSNQDRQNRLIRKIGQKQGVISEIILEDMGL